MVSEAARHPEEVFCPGEGRPWDAVCFPGGAHSAAPVRDEEHFAVRSPVEAEVFRDELRVSGRFPDEEYSSHASYCCSRAVVWLLNEAYFPAAACFPDGQSHAEAYFPYGLIPDGVQNCYVARFSKYQDCAPAGKRWSSAAAQRVHCCVRSLSSSSQTRTVDAGRRGRSYCPSL